MKTPISIWFLFVLARSVFSQTPWSFTDASYGQAATGSGFQSTSGRTYRNLLISLRSEGAVVCNYYNGASSNCFSLNVVFNTVEFFSEGGPSDPIYFLATPYTPTTQGVSMYQASATTTSVSANVVWDSSTDGYGGIIGVNIDYHHRWMALLTTSTLQVFDIRTITKPIRTDVITLTNTIGSNTHPRPVSLYKNRVCTSTSNNNQNKGIQCYSIRQGKITSAVVTADTSLHTRAIRIFDDFIIVAGGSGAPGAGLILYNATSLQKLATAVFAGGSPCPIDYVRSGIYIVAGDWCSGVVYIFNISNPSSPSIVYQQTISATTHTLFSDVNAVYLTHCCQAGNLRTLSNFAVPGGYQTFHERSEWFNYGNAVSTLSVIQSSSFIMYYGNTTMTLPVFVIDTYLPNDVNITYIVVSKPMNDFALEIKSGNNWFNLTLGSAFTQSMLQAGQVQVRYLNLPNPLTRNLNQTILLTADNNRNSRLNVTLRVTRLYGSACPIGATCTDSAFECMPGYSINLNADGCTLCSVSYYKPISGNSACSPCPLNSECPDTGMSSFSCAKGFTISGDTTSCVSCTAGQYKSTTGNGPCTACPSNADCTATPYANFTCRAGFTTSNDSMSCVSCLAGQYKSVSGNGPCTACPSNADCTATPYTNFTCRAGFTTSNDSMSCVSCLAGQYKSLSGNGPCTACPAQANCLSSPSTQFTCNAGYTLSVDETSCQRCAVNSFKEQPGNSACLPCPPNADCSTGTTFTCPPAYFWNSTANACQNSQLSLISSVFPSPSQVQPTPSSPRANTDILTMLLSNPLYLGLSIGALILIALIALTIAFMCWRRRNQAKSNNKSLLNTTSNGTTSIFSDATNTTTNSSVYSGNITSRYSMGSHVSQQHGIINTSIRAGRRTENSTTRGVTRYTNRRPTHMTVVTRKENNVSEN